MKPSILSQILELSLAERLRLAQDLWETVVDLPELGELTDLQRQELDRRLESLDRDPDQGIPWQQVLDDIRAGR